AVLVERLLRLLGEIQQIRHRRLHLEGELEGLDHAVDLVRRPAGGGEVAVHVLDQVELLALKTARQLGLQVGQVARVAQARALEVGRKKSAAEIGRSPDVRRRVDRDVAGQVDRKSVV